MTLTVPHVLLNPQQDKLDRLRRREDFKRYLNSSASQNHYDHICNSDPDAGSITKYSAQEIEDVLIAEGFQRKVANNEM